MVAVFSLARIGYVLVDPDQNQMTLAIYNSLRTMMPATVTVNRQS